MNVQSAHPPLDARRALEVEAYIALIDKRLSCADALINGTVGRRLLKELVAHGIANLSPAEQPADHNRPHQNRQLTLAGIRATTNAQGDLTLLRCWQRAAINRLPRQ